MGISMRLHLPGMSWVRARTSRARVRACCLGSTFDTLSAERKQREPGTGSLSGVASRPAGTELRGQPLLPGIRTNSSGGLRLGSGHEGNRWPCAAEWWEARTETGVGTAGLEGDCLANVLGDHLAFFVS